MPRKLGILALALIWCLGASAAVNPGVITGTVRDTAGVPQMGAVVEILANSAARTQTVITNPKGVFTVAGMLPGVYTIKVTAPSFLPTIREQIQLQSGANLLLNLTLNTLFEAIQLVPRHKPAAESDDDWRWALRSMSNRPILRLADDKPLVVVQKGEDGGDGELKARVSFISSNDGDSFNATSTNFHVEQSIFGKRRSTPAKWSLNGGLGNNSTNPNAVIRAAYSREMPDGSFPEIALSAKHFTSLNPDQPAIQALALSIANSMTFGEYLGLEYGGETQMIQFKERATSYKPFAIVSAHPGKNTILQYRYATSVPDLRLAKGFDTAPADLSESSPRVTMAPQGQRVERDSHNEVSVSQRFGKNKVQVAVFADTIHNAALTGTGGVAFTADTNELIGDPYSGNFLYNGGNFHTEGVRAVYSHPVAKGIDGTLDYAYGGVLTAPENLIQVSQTSTGLVTSKRHAAAAKLSGTAPGSKTKVIASYRWLSGSALTPVDVFNASAGQTDPYLSFFVRQPIPTMHILPNGLEALVDVRNLLAQGYRPVLSADGSTVYLVQGTRCIRAGLSFNF
jgi:hypothetical protein